MRYLLEGNRLRSINSVKNLQRKFNQQYRISLAVDVWSQVTGPR